MGCNIVCRSSSSYDRPQERVVQKIVYKTPNPDPRNCIIEDMYELGNYQVVKIGKTIKEDREDKAFLNLGNLLIYI
jgi:hypothetical protein